MGVRSLTFSVFFFLMQENQDILETQGRTEEVERKENQVRAGCPPTTLQGLSDSCEVRSSEAAGCLLSGSS